MSASKLMQVNVTVVLTRARAESSLLNLKYKCSKRPLDTLLSLHDAGILEGDRFAVRCIWDRWIY